MFSQWRIPQSAVTNMRWNLCGDLCTGAAVDSTNFNDDNYNPGIKCDCNFPNFTCHVTALGFGRNNFDGSLPSELGNLRRLQHLYIDSSKVGGNIPSTFANLRNLQTVGASDNGFTGRIPDLIGSWSQLVTLQAIFYFIYMLLTWKISGLSNGTLDFIRDLKSLRVLDLRNNRLSGSIPDDIGEYTNLTQLDLSFNNLSGGIPRGLFNMSKLFFLSLGNNSLTGTLLNEKSETLTNIDLSYNELSGTLPSWAIDPTLQLNILVNNFTLDNSGLNCLQRGFPCGRGSPIFSNFGINCGGPQITSSSQIVHEQDNKPLGPSNYYLNPERRWGVSNVGRRDILRNNTESTKRQFNNTLASTSRQFTNAIDSQLFQTARISAGSLRYYVFALENGNYNLKLQFAEVVIEDGPTWKSLARRIFDIYIQGNQVFKDFDIKRAAGGDSFSLVTREVTVEVLNNYLDIHFFWARKGTPYIPNQGAYGPLISAISATPNFIPTVSNNPPSNNNKNNTGLIVGILVPIGIVCFLTLLAMYIILRRRKRRDTSGNYDEEFLGIDTSPYTFSYEDLRDATDDFSPENKLGEGGFGPVYKGILNDGRVIAVKQLAIASHQGKSQFVAEIATISAVQHRNLVKLYGCCIDGEKRVLVYEYLENKSLDQALFGSKKLSLTWSTRFEICMGIARGLSYLHEESRIRIIHRDVKSSNVLLDSNMNPKISDFGLAKLYDDKKTHLSTRVAGTFGYLAPVYAMWGHLTEKADVFGFGVVALEIISGRPNSDSNLKDEKIFLLNWVCFILFFMHATAWTRPSMSRVVAMLSGDIEVTNIINCPQYLTCFEFDYHTTFTSVITAAVIQAQNTTDPAEVRVINSMFNQWGIPESSVTAMRWNLTGDPCTGTAVDSTDINDDNYNPAIKCDCNFPNFTCHVTALKVYGLDVSGTIPEGLWTLFNLTILNLGQNYLTGPLSPSIGNLIRMEYLTISFNALSGQFPPEIGQLTDLRLLAFGTNNFDGSLPSEIGNLRKLKHLYFGSSGVGGYIPSTFANLQNLQRVGASDNGLKGRIPDFIGSWSQLQSLNLQGNSFEGSIPLSFSRLISLERLRISGLSNGTLDFIKDLKSLRILFLRSNRLSGSIPNEIGEFTNLTQLDLSFNNLSGPIPTGLFNLSRMYYLSLGNNSLTGTLPTGTLPKAMNTTLSYIDLSYNLLSGTLPSWALDPTLQLNILANNFTLSNSGLSCLQRGFPCGRGSPRYTIFGINCGGPQMTSSNRIVHEQDNEPLGPSTYYLTPERRWAVSNVGNPVRLSNTTDIESTKRQFTNTLASTLRQFTNTIDSGLFQTARLSSGSLRYYGLGLENGNYTVKLQFAELVIEDGPTRRSLGRRVFDIYIQGNQVFQDFDIKRAAGGASFSPLTREVTVEVLNNYLEIHLLWSGKGTCCIPDQGTYGPLISAVSATPNFIPTVNNNPPSNNKKNNTVLIVEILVPIVVVSFLTYLAMYILRRRRKRRDISGKYDQEFLGIEARPYTFCYEDLRDATDDFRPANKLGQGGFGPVYKGTLDDGRVVAVKQLSVASHQGKSQFVAEIATISAVQHRNLVKLYGCCIYGERRLLVYEYLENKSLDQALFGSNTLSLTWSTRFDICLGIARGLAYLHEESRVRIIHRDVKSSNILLDSNMNPKISDFGLAKLYDDKNTHLSTRVAGTFGYLAPEYAMRGHLTEKADVFGFGVVALEIISGRPNCDSSLEDDKTYLLGWAWKLHETNRELELVDEKLSEFDESVVKRVIRVALLCTQTSSSRPSMSRVVALLSGDMKVSGVITRPEYLTCLELDYSITFKSSSLNSIDSQPMLHNIM
ncbi:hypothetical protein LXL04_037153 [Taraxacum kok-saghyz]